MTTRAQPLASMGNAWAAGHRLGPFELLEVVSSRSGAVVYRAWDHALQRPVAVKEYLPARLARRNTLGGLQPATPDDAVAFELGRRAFIDEARQLARCDHPSLLRVLDLLELHGTAYRVMPWLAGTPLSELRLGMAGPPDEAALVRLADELLGALETWHAAVGTPHGGVEPAQVMLLEDDRAMLLGPGLPRRLTASDAVETLMRQLEPAWAAPEQMEPSANRPPGPWSDFHALGHTLRFALTGQPPPPVGAPPQEALAATVERLFDAAPGARCSAALLQTLENAVAPDAALRPQTAQQFRALMAGEALLPPPAPDPMPPAAEAPAPAAEPTTPAPAPEDDSAAPVVERAAALLTPRVPPTAPVPPEAPAPAAPEPPPMADDETTARLIRSVIASIPDAPPRVPTPPVAPTPTPTPAPALPASPPAAGEPPPAEAPAPAQALAPPRRARRLAAGALVVLGGAAAWLAWSSWQDHQRSARLAALPAPAEAVAPLPQAASAPASAPDAVAVAPAASAPPETPASAPAAASAPASAPESAAPPEPAPPAPAPAAEPPAPKPAPAPAPAARAAAPSTPRELCGARSDFALYRCFQQQCAKAAWARHPQCVAFMRTDHVPP